MQYEGREASLTYNWVKKGLIVECLENTEFTVLWLSRGELVVV